MTYAPASLLAAARYWVANGGINSGIVGDAAHAARATYHNGLDRAIARLGTSDMNRIAVADYTFRLARDRAGASNAAMGLDLGAADKTLLRRFSVWLVEQCKADAPGTEDIREVIYSPDGRVVKRWDAPYHVIRDGYPVAQGQGDATHLWHTHISFYRDSEARDKVGLFRPYFEPDQEADMPFNVSPPWAGLSLPAGSVLYDDAAKAGDPDEPDRIDPDNVTIGGEPLPRRLRLLGRYGNDVRVVAYKATDAAFTRTWYVRPGIGGIVTLSNDELGIPEPPAAQAPDCADEIAEAVKADRLSARIVWEPV